jgi:general secretion pathway protein M
MKIVLSAMVSRIAAGMLFVLVLLMVVVGIIVPIADGLAGAKLSSEEYQSALMRGRVIDQELKNLNRQLTELRQVQASQSGFLEGGNESLATAQLQNRIKTIVETDGGELRSTQVLPVRDDGKFRRIIVRGQMATNTIAMQRVFYDIESASPYLILDNIDIRARPSSHAQENGPTDPMLDIRFDLYGYVRGNS